jgi:arylsulfatase A-like enzyme
MAKQTRREFLKALGSAAASAGAFSLLPGCAGIRQMMMAKSKRPNIIFIMTDDHAAGAMSCYGSKINKTPNLDRLAKEGMLFKNCFCTNSICAPSRAVILTGKYSHINGVVDNVVDFDGTQPTFPALLHQAGYQTALIGKWHLKSEPVGFDYWSILTASGGQGVYYNPTMDQMGKRKKIDGYVTDIITDIALDFLQNVRDRSKPFLMLYQHKAPHRHWEPGPKYQSLYDDVEIPEPQTFNDDYKTRCDAARLQEMTVEHHLDQQDLKIAPPQGLSGQALKKWKYQRYIKDYLRCIASVDENVGRLLDYLDRTGLAENTVVVYTSDQGFFLGDHGWFDKRFMYEESIRMPLLVRYPRQIKPGSTNSDIVLNLDFAPTLLDLAAVPIPADIQGRSFRPILDGGTPWDWRKSMYYHYYEYPGWHSVRRHYGIRTERYKLIHFYYDIDAWELYDLHKDPHELNNVYDNPAYAEVVKQLKAELLRLRKQYGDSDELTMKILREHPIGDGAKPPARPAHND